MLLWIVLGVIVAILATVFTLVWWWVGDQWANDEHKKFHHEDGVRVSQHTQVIRDPQPDEASAEKGAGVE